MREVKDISTEVEKAKQTDHFELLCDFSELSWVFSDSEDLDSFLHKIVVMVKDHMHTSACTIFLYDEVADDLVVRAQEGHDQSSVGKIRLKVGEGLTGLAIKERRPINVQNPEKHPSFRYFMELDEEKYHSFLSVPIMRGIAPVGVITLRRERAEQFSHKDVQALRVIASQLASILESASLFRKLLPERNMAHLPKALNFREQKVFQGKSASDGFAMGKALILDRVRSFSSMEEESFDRNYTLEDLNQAFEKTEEQLTSLQKDIEEKLDDAASLIFTSHLLILKDPSFNEEIETKISGGMNAPKALLDVAKHYIDILIHSENPYIQEKVRDVEDLVLRILVNLDEKKIEFASVKNKIVIARQLYPSDLLVLSSERVAGIVMISGGITSHIAILARSLRTPMIIADVPQLLDIPSGVRLILDADLGNVYVNPPQAAVKSFYDRRRTQKHIRTIKPDVKPETFTKDGTRVHLMANINLFGDLKHALELNAEGVGLYRTEFPFLIRNDFPTEEEQYVIYRRIVRGAGAKELVFRTLDIGGDKVFAYYEDYEEANPVLGMRSIRFSLQNPESFKPQIRAMLRACKDRSFKVMFPMISSVEEFLKARAILFECRDELIREGIRFSDEPKVGMMIEVPSLVEIIYELVEVSDFFSLGTNDFIQYLLGVDRTNEKVSSFYLPHHPAVLRSLKRIVDATTKGKKEISICGAMGHQQSYVPFLLGIGVRIFSMNPMYLSRIQKYICEQTIEDCESLAKKLLKTGSINEMDRLLELEKQQ